MRPRLLPARPATRRDDRRRPDDAPPRPLVVAHRGASTVAAEHTLAAYEAAIASGADALECDVRMTRDEHLVCVHDRRVNRTSDGTGRVSDLDLTSLANLDFSSWHSGVESTASADELITGGPHGDPYDAHAYDPADDGGTDLYHAGVAADRVDAAGGVLTLEMLLGLVHDAGRPVRLLIETKHPTRYGGLVEKTLVEQLDRFGWAGPPGPATSLRDPVDETSPAVVMSFAPTAVRRIRLLAPRLPTVLLLDRLLPLRRDGLLPAGVTIAGPGLRSLRADPGFVQRAHDRGHPVFVWTVNDPADVAFVRDLGVDAIITDRAGEVVDLLDDDPSR